MPQHPGDLFRCDQAVGNYRSGLERKRETFTLSAGGILARVIQHEYDHLRGVLFLDHLDEKKRSRLIKVYEKKSKI